MKKIPEASVNRAKKTIMYKGVTTYSNIYATVTVSDKKYVPTKKGVINCTSHPWEKVPDYIQESYMDAALDRLLINKIGMNPNYNDKGTKYD